jgi:hypothetical protein
LTISGSPPLPVGPLATRPGAELRVNSGGREAGIAALADELLVPAVAAASDATASVIAEPAVSAGRDPELSAAAAANDALTVLVVEFLESGALGANRHKAALIPAEVSGDRSGIYRLFDHVGGIAERVVTASAAPVDVQQKLKLRRPPGPNIISDVTDKRSGIRGTGRVSVTPAQLATARA